MRAIITENALFPSTVSINTIQTKCKEDKEENVYNPFRERKLEHPNSDMRSFANLLKSSLGSGILAMPAAFVNAGSLVGIFGTIILGYICTHCVYLLVKTSQDVARIRKIPSLGYAETVESVFISGPRSLRKYSNFARIFIDWTMAFTILGACAAYVLMLEESVKQIVDHFYVDNKISKEMYCLMFLVPVLLFTQIRNLKYLAPFSGFANLMLVTVFLICIYYICLDFPALNTTPLSVSIYRLPLFVSTVIFAMEGIGVVLPVENSMARPEHFLGCPGVLNISMTVVVFLYMVMGFLGYVRYGSLSESVVTKNLPTNEIPALMAKGLIIIAIFFTYTLQFYVPMEIVWRNTKDKVSAKYQNWAQSLMRAVFSSATVASAAILPELKSAIELEGAIFYATLGLVVPALLELIFRWERDLGKYKWIMIKDITLALFGIFVLISGVSKSLYDIIYPEPTKT